MNILNKCTPKTIQSPAELLASSRPSPLAATSSCAALWHAASHMLQQAWLQRAWNVLVTTSRQDKTSPVTTCYNMLLNATTSGTTFLWPCKSFRFALAFSMQRVFSTYTYSSPSLHFLELIIPYSSFSELFTVILVGVCAQHRALVGVQPCPTLTWYEKVWASCTLILCKKGALDCLPRGTATVGVGCSKGSNTDCLQASSNIFKPASYNIKIFDDDLCKGNAALLLLRLSNRVPLHSVFCIVLPW